MSWINIKSSIDNGRSDRDLFVEGNIGPDDNVRLTTFHQEIHCNKLATKYHHHAMDWWWRIEDLKIIWSKILIKLMKVWSSRPMILGRRLEDVAFGITYWAHDSDFSRRYTIQWAIDIVWHVSIIPYTNWSVHSWYYYKPLSTENRELHQGQQSFVKIEPKPWRCSYTRLVS